MNQINRVRSSLLLLAFLTSLACAAPKEPGDVMPRVDSAIRAEMLRQQVPGVALGIVEGGG